MKFDFVQFEHWISKLECLPIAETNTPRVGTIKVFTAVIYGFS
jgi:hypothetical protein